MRSWVCAALLVLGLGLAWLASGESDETTRVEHAGARVLESGGEELGGTGSPPLESGEPVVAGRPPAAVRIVPPGTYGWGELRRLQRDEAGLGDPPGTRRHFLRLLDRSRDLVLLKSGHFRPRPGAPVQVGDDPRHLAVRFTGPLDTALRAKLARIGVRPLAYLPRRTHVVRLSAKGLEDLIEAGLIDRAFNLLPEDRLARPVREGTMPPHSVGDDGRLRLRVDFHDDVSPGAAETALRTAGAEITSSPRTGARGYRILLARERVLVLAGESAVHWIEPVAPPKTTTNAVAARRGNASAAPFLLPIAVDGTGVRIGLWDEGRVQNEHEDFQGRVTIAETTDISSHATHVSGTIAGSGKGSLNARGMAPAALLFSYFFNGGDNWDEMRAARDIYGIELSNNSWGFVVGWNGLDFLDNQYRFGQYSSISADWDQMVRDTGILTFKSAGNDRTDANPFDGSDHDGTLVNGDYYDVIPSGSIAKNILTIGATRDDDTMTSFSSWGPADDGRLKPDLVANGFQLVSVYPFEDGNYGQISGTSMSSPAACGQAALVFDLHRRLGAPAPTVSRMKALLVNTAGDLVDDGGVAQPHRLPGPDYATGHGMLDSASALAFTHADLRTDLSFDPSFITTGTFATEGETAEVSFVVTSDQPEVAFTLAWVDPTGSPAVNPALVNDLDLALVSPDGTKFYPWVLDPAAPATAATRGVNTVDTVEKVFLAKDDVETAGATWAGTWTAKVTAWSLPRPPQEWSMAGNLSTGSLPAGTAPTMTVTNPTGSSVGATFDLRVEATATRGVMDVQYRLDDGPWQSLVPTEGTTEYTSFRDPTFVSSGSTVIDVRCRDLWGVETRLTRTLTASTSDVHPGSAAATTSPRDDAAPDGAPGFGVIGGSSDVDTFRLSLDGSRTYTFETVLGSLSDSTLTLLDTDGSTTLTAPSHDDDAHSFRFSRITSFTPSTTGTYFVQVAGDGTATGDYALVVGSHPAGLTPRLTATPTSGVAPLAVSFTDTTTQPVTSRIWTFGDGETSAEKSPTHTYLEGGVYLASLQSSNAAGSRVSDRTAIVVDDHPDTAADTTDTRDRVPTDGTVVEATLHSDDDIDFFRFEATASTTYTFSTTLGAMQDTFLEVIDTDGSSVLASNDDISGASGIYSAVSAAPSQTSTYFVKVFRAAGEPGSYGLRIRTATSVDLTVSSVTAPSAVSAGAAVTLRGTVTNTGSEAVTGGFLVRAYLSRDTSMDVLNDTFLDERTIPLDLSAGASFVVTFDTLPIPEDQTSGTYFLGLLVDADNRVAESSETNNTGFTSSMTLTAVSRSPASANRPPRVSTQRLVTTTQGQVVTLAATATDPDGDTLTYEWAQTDGPAVVLGAPSSSTTTFLASGGSLFSFRVTVTDSVGSAGFGDVEVQAAESGPPILTLRSVQTDSTRVSRGQTGIEVTMDVENSGLTGATVVSASPLFDGTTANYAVSPAPGNPTLLPAGQTESLSFDVAVGDTAPLGTTSISGKLDGRSLSTGETLSATPPATVDSWLVQARAAVAIRVVTASADQVFRGESTETVTMSVENTGQATAVITEAALLFDGGTAGYGIIRESGPAAIAGGETETFSFSVTVTATAPLGPTSIDGRITARDTNSATLTTSDSSADSRGSWEVSAPALLELIEVRASPERVSLGQVVQPVDVVFQNLGTRDATVTSLLLSFNGSTAGYETELQTGPASVPGQQTSTWSFAVTVLSTATLGTTTLNAQVLGEDSEDPSRTTSDGGVDSPDAWTVQRPADLTVRTVRPARETVSRGQTITVEVEVENLGGASGELSEMTLTFDGATEGYEVTAPPLPLSVPGEAETTLSVSVQVLPAATTGTVVLDAAIAGADGNDPAQTTTDDGADTPGSWTVQRPAELRLLSVSSEPEFVRRGEIVSPVTVALRNEGEASATLGTISLLLRALRVMATVSPLLMLVLGACRR